jgi:RecB family exonuclease
VITPRRTRLVRAPDLHAFRRAIAALAGQAVTPVVVVVPSRGAGQQLAATVRAMTSAAGLDEAADLAGVQFATRDQLYDALHERLPSPPPRLSSFERDAIAQASAREAAAAVHDTDEPGGAPRRLRPGLVAEMLRFYDLLRRQSQQVQRFEELISERLEPQLEVDPGADRMLQQTRFLAATFRAYERRVRASGSCDEHLLRDLLISQASADPVPYVIVTVPDWIADPDGLFVADFDLLARIPGLARLDIVATESVLGSGFHQRLHDWWPGIEEESADSVAGAPIGRSRPILSTPSEEALWTTVRDRQEELIDVARRVAAERRRGDGRSSHRAAVVYKRPLPYVYLAPDTLGAAGIPFQTADALPLAAEPTAAALDLLLELAANDFTRADIVALLRSPHLRVPTLDGDQERDLARAEVSALDRELSDRRYLGDVGRLREIAGSLGPRARPAADAILRLAAELEPLASRDRASRQAALVADCFERHLRPLAVGDPFAVRERRARAALVDGIRALAHAHRAHEDPDWTIDDVASAIRRWIENETFDVFGAADGGVSAGPPQMPVAEPTMVPVQLLDDRAARYGDFDDVTIVGLVEGDWPERSRRNIFYGSSLMKALGWPSEKDRRAAAESRFLDLMASASARVALSTFTLDDEMLVEPSTLLDEVPRARLSTVPREPAEPIRIFPEEALSLEPVDLDALDETAREWALMRTARSPHDAPMFHGQVEPLAARAWSVSAIETYLGCPFRFFAQHVLRLDEDPDDDEVMDPRAQGEFVHKVFEIFFRTWHDAGRGAVTPANIDEARALFTAVVDAEAERLPGAEGALERTRLVGSPAAGGLGEAVLRMEAERPARVVDRLLEHELRGEFTIATAAGPRVVSLRGKADRIDLLEDGTFRLIDYKLGWPPDRRKALQLPIYGVCAEQRLAGRHGRTWRLGDAVYLAFKGPRRVVPLFTAPSAREEVMADAQQRLSDALDAIGRGAFPPTPDDVHRCETCTYSPVCRKDYVGEV